MLLAHTIHGEDTDSAPLVIAHGLFGAARNWSALAKHLARRRRVIAVDMRNHGNSAWADTGGYPDMAADLVETIDAIAGGPADVLGHSMGGKAAMALALTEPRCVARLIVADIAPVTYGHGYDRLFAAMRGLHLAGLTRRSEADPLLTEAIPDAAMRVFILQNLVIGASGARWQPNVDALARLIGDLVAFPSAWPHAAFAGPALFLHGGASDYVTEAMHPAIRTLFPAADIVALPGAGHWLHAEQPRAFLAAVEHWLE